MKRLFKDSKFWLFLAFGLLVIYWQNKAKTGTTTPVVSNLPDGFNYVIGAGTTGGGNTTPTTTPTTPTVPTVPTVEGVTYLSELPDWLSAIGLSRDSNSNSNTFWATGNGVLQINIQQGTEAKNGDGWAANTWGNMSTPTDYSIAPWGVLKRFNKGTGTGLADMPTTINIRRMATPNVVYRVTENLVSTGGAIKTVIQKNTTPVLPTTPTNPTEVVTDTIEYWANKGRTYGQPRLKYVNDTAFFNPRIVDNNDGTISVIDDAKNYQPGPGKMICYELNYYGIERDIREIDSRTFYKPYSVLIAKYECDAGGDQGMALIGAKQEINQVIY